MAPRLSTHASESSVVLIDLDNFKRYNDRRGHAAGDRLLVAFADTLRRSVREDDVVFRIGGDEFLLMLVGADHTEAEQVLDRLRHRWSEVGGPVGFSAVIAAGEQDLMRLADEHMYANKRSRDLSEELARHDPPVQPVAASNVELPRRGTRLSEAVGVSRVDDGANAKSNRFSQTPR